MQFEPRSFWDITAANVVTWLILVAGFIGSQYVALKLLGQRMKTIERWAEVHEKEVGARDELVRANAIAVAKLSTLAENADQRLRRLEDVDDRHRARGRGGT